jgi:hypothetical protein
MIFSLHQELIIEDHLVLARNVDPEKGETVKRKRQLKMRFIPHEEVSSALPIFCEPISLLELAVLRLSPVYYGLSVPAGDGSRVVIIPGLLGTDLVLLELHAWLSRLGYRPYFSGMGIAADCPHVARAAPGRHYQARVRGNQAPGAPGRPQLGRRIRPIRGCPHARPRRRRSLRWLRRFADLSCTAQCWGWAT